MSVLQSGLSYLLAHSVHTRGVQGSRTGGIFSKPEFISYHDLIQEDLHNGGNTCCLKAPKIVLSKCSTLSTDPQLSCTVIDL